MKRFVIVILTLVLAVFLTVPALAAQYDIAAPVWVTVDGVISADEWGKPLYRGVTLGKAEEGSWDGQLDAWWYDGNSEENVYFDLYVNNNNDFIYIGCVIHNTSIDSKSKGADIWKYQNFAFTFSPYERRTTVPHLMFEGKEYELYTGYRIAMLHDGTPISQTITQGKAGKELFAGSDYQIKYDSQNRTMTYEAAIPLNYAYTNVDLSVSREIAFSALISLNYANNFVSASKNGSNRFLIGTGTALHGGPENYAHAGHAITIQLNDPELTDELDPNKQSEEESSPSSSAAASALDESPILLKDSSGGSASAASKTTLSDIVLIASVALIVTSLALAVFILLRRKSRRAVEQGNTGEGRAQSRKSGAKTTGKDTDDKA